MSIRKWRELLQRDAVAAWTELEAALNLAASQLARRGAIRKSDAEDFARTALVRLLANGGRDADRAAPTSSLDAWAAGVVRNIARRAYAESPRSVSLDAAEASSAVLDPDWDADAGPDVGTHRPSRDDLDAILERCRATPGQRAIYDLVVHEGLRLSQAARRLRIDRKSAWERLQRFQARAARFVRNGDEEPSRDLAWIPAAIARWRVRGDARGVRVLELLAVGRTHAEIAATVGLTPGYVAVKVQRARRRWRRARVAAS